MNHQLIDQLGRLAALRGLTVKAGQCEKHGDFEAMTPEGVAPACQECREISAQEEARQRWLVDRVSAIRKHIGVPGRFASSGFREFVPTTENASAVKAMVAQYLRDVREHQAAWRPLMLSGSPGTGKTHLLCALTNNLAQLAIPARYTTLQGMLSDIKSAYSDNSKTEAGQILRWVQVDFLAIDEIDVMRASDNDLVLLFQVINGRYNDLKPTAIASNQPVSALAKFVSDRVMDRLAENAVALNCDWPSARAAA